VVLINPSYIWHYYQN